MSRHKRSRNLIEPRMQLRFGVLFLVTGLIAILVQALFLAYALQQVAGELPADGFHLVQAIPAVQRTTVLATILLMAPFTLVLGVLATFRIAGPLYRMRVYLQQLVAGERPGACKIREGDELQELCTLLNQATAPLREGGAEREAGDERVAA